MCVGRSWMRHGGHVINFSSSIRLVLSSIQRFSSTILRGNSNRWFISIMKNCTCLRHQMQPAGRRCLSSWFLALPGALVVCLPAFPAREVLSFFSKLSSRALKKIKGKLLPTVVSLVAFFKIYDFVFLNDYKTEHLFLNLKLQNFDRSKLFWYRYVIIN